MKTWSISAGHLCLKCWIDHKKHEITHWQQKADTLRRVSAFHAWSSHPPHTAAMCWRCGLRSTEVNSHRSCHSYTFHDFSVAEFRFFTAAICSLWYVKFLTAAGATTLLVQASGARQQTPSECINCSSWISLIIRLPSLEHWSVVETWLFVLAFLNYTSCLVGML